MKLEARLFLLLLASLVPLSWNAAGQTKVADVSVQTKPSSEGDEPKIGGEDVPLPDSGKKALPSRDVGEDPCSAGIAQDNGVVTLTLKDPARAGKGAEVTLDDFRYAAHFDESGVMRTRLPLLREHADLAWEGAGGERCHRRGISFKNYDSMVMAALVWKGDFFLGLHVVEPPFGRIGGQRNYVSPKRPNRDHRFASGDLETFGEPGNGTTQVQLYTLPLDQNPRIGDLYFYVEFASRGNPARPPFCGNDPRADVPYQLIEFDMGQRKARGGHFPSVPCGTSWTAQQVESGYLQRWPRLKL